MKLVRYGAAGKEKPGIVDNNGKIRDLSKVVKDINGEALSSAGLAKIKKANIDKLPKVAGNPRLGPCVARPSNFIAIGLNYADHAAEAGMKLPPEPIIFNKALSCICGPNDNTITPKGSTKLDYEVELGIVIGKRASYLKKEQAMGAVAGYFLSNDVSERNFQIERAGQWTKGKGCETLRPDRPLDGQQGRDQGPAEPQHLAQGQRRVSPEGQHQDDDLRRRRDRLVVLAVLHHGARRHHRHRHTIGCGAGHEARAEVPPGRRRGRAWLDGLGTQKQKVVKARA